MTRGRLRIYLGAAPGVGKTYAMLAEGHRRLDRGTDVVIGFVESHGRKLTIAMAEGLRTVPRRALTYRGVDLTEMDLAAVLARRPQVVLVDELAHTNVPGSVNEKRWQDVDQLLAAGIDVVSTLNIQHLESLNDVVEDITGIRQRETIADEVVRRADQIELVDMTPEALRRRMVHGNVYPPDRVDTALTHYFRPGNLTALRELALLWVADRVEEGLQRYRAEHGIAGTWETRERVAVGLLGHLEDEVLIRRAARITARIPGSDLLAVHVVSVDGLTETDPAVLATLRELVEDLGGSYHQVLDEDVAEGLRRFTRSESITQLVLGAGHRGPLRSLLLGEGVGSRVIRLLGSVDVHVVTHGHAAGSPGRSTRWRWYGAAAIGGLLLAVAVALGPQSFLPAALTVLAVGIAAWQANSAARSRLVASALTTLAAGVPRGQVELPALLELVRETVGLAAVSLLEPRPGSPDWYVIASAGDRPPERPDQADVRVPATGSVILAGRGRMRGTGDRQVLLACATQLAADLSHQRITEHAAELDERAAADRTRGTLLATATHDLQTALNQARDALAKLADQDGEHVAATSAAVERIGLLVADLLVLTRLRAGALDLYLRAVDVDEVIAAALEALGPGGPDIELRMAEDVPDVIADAATLIRAVTTLTARALRHSLPGRPPSIVVTTPPGHVEIQILDHDSAVDPATVASVALRVARGLIEAIGGQLRCARTEGGGLRVIVRLPSAR
ncbi:sensor histidine kinase [Kutzneria albida]|uniref:histidine kinase n=1 Tax=Kutzneria albida DSM 43870 TaxID=1449976 RepID=W5W977_9PSEU|nr:hypothetical protein [Kutzneria albida]AHH97512.1 hypothetical protein KALB_4148 [Kutzneria albida DSM 43870]